MRNVEPLARHVVESVATSNERPDVDCVLNWREPWLTCRPQRTHPLEPSTADGEAVWVCPTDDEIVARIGDLDAVQLED